jgi:F0F1-type ATP synthase membrane subunit b/b'
MTEKKESKRITFCRKEKKCKTKLTINVFYKKQEWSDNMLKDAREIKEKMIADSKDEAQAQGLKMIEQAKQQLKVKNAAMAELKLQVSTLSLSIAEKLLKDELSRSSN